MIRLGNGFSMPTNGSVGTLTLSPRYVSQVGRMLERERFDLLHFHEPFVPFLSLDPAARVAQRERRHVPRLRRLLAVVRVRAAGSCRATRPGCTAGSRSARRPATSSTATSRATTRSSPTASTWPASSGPCPSRAGRTARPTSCSSAASSRARACSTCSRRTASCAATGCACRLLVVGSGPQEREARRYVLTRRLLGVEFLGRVSDDEKAQLFRTADVFVSPATGRESFGIVLLEAMAAGAPIVCSRHPRLQGRRAAGREGPAGRAARPEASWPWRSPGCSATRPCARAMRRARPGPGRGVQLAAHDRQGRGLLRLRDPPAGRAGRLPAGLPCRDPTDASSGRGQLAAERDGRLGTRLSTIVRAPPGRTGSGPGRPGASPEPVADASSALAAGRGRSRSPGPAVAAVARPYRRQPGIRADHAL